MRPLLTLLIGLVLAAAATVCLAAPGQDKRVALVIGNSAYRYSPRLANPRNDAEDLTKALRGLGFEVADGYDLDSDAMISLLERFSDLVEGAEAALVFYAGHGIQYKGRNYLVPVDAKLTSEISIQGGKVVPVDLLVGALDRARNARILILDACRDLPLAGGRRGADVFGAEGLARIAARQGMVVAYAAQADAVAYDGKGRNSVFSGALLKEINEPGLEITQLLRRVGAQVERQTQGRQTPELSLSLFSEFYFNRGETDLQAWQRLGAKPNPDELRAFGERFSNSPYALVAKERLDLLAERKRREMGEEERERTRAGSGSRNDRQLVEPKQDETLAWKQLESNEQRKRRQQGPILEGWQQPAPGKAGQQAALGERSEPRDWARVEPRPGLDPHQPDVPGTAIGRKVAPAPTDVKLHRRAERALRDMGCLGTSGRRSTTSFEAALEHYFKRLGSASEPLSEALVRDLEGRGKNYCAPACGPGERAAGERCIAAPAPKSRAPAVAARKAKIAPRIARRRQDPEEDPPAPHLKPKARAEYSRPSRAPAAAAGARRCFTFNGQSYCD